MILPAALAGFALACGGNVQAGPPATPQATLQPAQATVAAGATQSFTAVFTSAVPADLQWTAAGGTIAPQPPSGDQASGTFTAGTTPGTYTVALSAGTGPLASATVVVTASPTPPPPAPSATLSPTVVNVAAGATTTLTATAVNLDPAALVWSASGGSIQTGAASGNQVSAVYAAGSTAGTFGVSVAASAGSAPLATAAITITASAPPPPAPTATLTPATVSVVAGATTTLTATASNLDPAALVWSATGGSLQAGSAAGNQISAVYTAGATAGTYQVSVAASAGASALATSTVTVTAAASAPPPPTGQRTFRNAAANWLYSAPTGTGINISSITSGLNLSLNAHDTGFDYPVVTTDGTHGCTTFTDTLQYAYTDKICVPNPAGGYHPSVGGYGANDGHLVVLDASTGDYYDFWKLYTSNGVPNSTNVGAIVHGNVSGDGTPGTTAANITGLAGDIMPGELDCDTCLNHALSVIVPGADNSNVLGQQAPVTHTDGSVSGAVFREGAKIRFDPSIDVSALQASTAAKAILRALQLYGGVITDQTGGSAIGIYSALPTAPDLSGLQQAGAHMFIYY